MFEFTPRQLEMTLKLARGEEMEETAARLAYDRIAQHGDRKTVERAMKDLSSEKVWRSR